LFTQTTWALAVLSLVLMPQTLLADPTANAAAPPALSETEVSSVATETGKVLVRSV
jgi:hypothetical protein